MLLVKSTKKYWIYSLSDREKLVAKKEYDVSGINYLIYLKSNYEDSKPSFKYDFGYQDWEASTLEEAIEFCDSV